MHTLAWRTGFYGVRIDATSFLGPLICGFLGEASTGAFIALVGLAAVDTGIRLVWRSLV